MEMKRSLFWCDVVTGISVFLMLTARFTSQAYFSRIQEASGTAIENVVKVMEASPVNALVFQAENIGTIWSYLVLPALMIGIYILYRRGVVRGKINMEYFIFFVAYIFFMMLVDTLNDLAHLLGAML